MRNGSGGAASGHLGAGSTCAFRCGILYEMVRPLEEGLETAEEGLEGGAEGCFANTAWT